MRIKQKNFYNSNFLAGFMQRREIAFVGFIQENVEIIPFNFPSLSFTRPMLSDKMKLSEYVL